MDNLPRPSLRIRKNTIAFPRPILEWLLTLPPTEAKIVTAIVAQTYGWNKDSDFISYSQFIKKTGCSREALARALSGLRKSGFIRVTDAQGDEIENPSGKKLYYSFLYSEDPVKEIPPSWPEKPKKTTFAGLKNELVYSGPSSPEIVLVTGPKSEQVSHPQVYYSETTGLESEQTKGILFNSPLLSKGEKPKNSIFKDLANKARELANLKPSDKIQSKFQYYALEAVKAAGLEGEFASRIFKLFKEKDYGEFQVKVTRDVASGDLYPTLSPDSKVRYLIGAYKKSI